MSKRHGAVEKTGTGRKTKMKETVTGGERAGEGLKPHICLIFAALYAGLALLFFTEALVTAHLDYALPFVGYGGTFRYAAIPVGGHSISLYYTAHLLGVLGMILLCLYRTRDYRIGKTAAVLTAVLLALFGYLGAKLLYILENFEHVMTYGLNFGGVSFFGTVFFMPIVIPLMALLFGQKPSEFLDYCTPAGILMLTCIRTGCFMKGCCHGISFWIMERPVTLPSQLIECSLDMLLLYLILTVEKKGSQKGKLYFLFMGGYGLLRFFLEFIRDTPKDILHLSRGQWFSLLCILICTIIMKNSGRRQKT